ncbi:MAG: hypothetical protein RLZZ350_465 [Verrucomicrobiota bacterium]|jgi:glycosyltransferase involved in cell wall biosynthesis
MKLGILTSHPIQYQAPWFRALARECDLQVFFAHHQTAAEQGKAGFGVAFEWDVDLLAGYEHKFLKNISATPGVNSFAGCDTPEIYGIIGGKDDETIDHRLKISGGARSLPSLMVNSPIVAPSSPFDAFIVTGWYLKTYRQAMAACRAAGVPVLVRGDSQLLTPRSVLKRLAMEFTQRRLLRQFDGFLAVGQRHREYLEHFGALPEKIFPAPHFVDNEWFKGKADEVRSAECGVRNQWGADARTFVTLFVGKFQPEKRPGDLLHALARIKTHTPHTTHHAVFIGAGELEEELRATAVRLGVNAHFAGFKNQSELPACYAAANALVLPSQSETWGLVVNEAMACGCPAVVSDAVGCAPDLIVPGETGFTFPVGDAGALAERLATLAKMKSAGHDFAPALTAKLKKYSVAAAVAGTLAACAAVRR